jgi:hypothetical protein
MTDTSHGWMINVYDPHRDLKASFGLDYKPPIVWPEDLTPAMAEAISTILARAVAAWHQHLQRTDVRAVLAERTH